MFYWVADIDGSSEFLISITVYRQYRLSGSFELCISESESEEFWNERRTTKLNLCYISITVASSSILLDWVSFNSVLLVDLISIFNFYCYSLTDLTERRTFPLFMEAARLWEMKNNARMAKIVMLYRIMNNIFCFNY